MTRILIVDDDPLVRRLVSAMIRSVSRQHDVILARDGLVGLELLTKEPPVDLIVTDMVMPRCDGLAFIAALKQRQITVPVIAMSSSMDHLRHALVIGADETLPKPFLARQFHRAVGRLLRVWERGEDECGDELTKARK